MLHAKGPWYVELADGSFVTIIDASGNISAPVTTTSATFSGNTTMGDASADTLTINATTTALAPITVGVNDTGHDVKFFGATAGKSWLWDESADKMIVTGASDLIGNTQQTGTLIVGVDDTGYDVQFFGATASSHMLWDESADSLLLVGAAKLTVAGLATFSSGFSSSAVQRTPDAVSGPNALINPGVTAVDVGAVLNDVNDWIVLPALSSVPVGHTIHIACNAGTAFEIRTPASSNEKINNVDADGGSAELTCVDTELVIMVKISDADGWSARSITLAGATNTALTPSA